ncbi:MAG TPA: helix-turn-helix transcriptional regulator [Reyranella sp.]|nr:helix-turn-helix transcriptional regulator [Reyranella sp.]
MEDDLLSTIEAVHAAGLDDSLWQPALGAITRAIGGLGATLEVIDKSTARHSLFFASVPAQANSKYLDHYMTINPRVPVALRQKRGELSWDYLHTSEAEIDRHPFYREFLSSIDLRYQIGGTLRNDAREYAAFTVQRTRRQGHVAEAEVRRTRLLLPHVGQALDVTMRLREANAVRQSLERALDYLADGVALLAADGTIVHANEAFQAIARRGDGFRVNRRALDVTQAAARGRLETALADAARLSAGELQAAAPSDFPVPRGASLAPYLFSVRSLLGKGRGGAQSDAVAILFVRDPSARGALATPLMREVYGFTEAEADLARALQSGLPLGDYARLRGVSLNTIYTHLRRIKTKTQSNRLTELIHKLNDLQLSAQLR